MKLPVGAVRGAVTLALIVANTIALSTPLLIVALAKLAVPVASWRRVSTRWLIAIATQWADNNSSILRKTQEIHWTVTGAAELDPNQWYLVIANHRSWVDIFALHAVLNRRIPFLKFFLKQELIWMPVMGLAWWSLDMPFMKRYSRPYLERHPEKKGRDLEITRKACEKFQLIPTSVINFVEGRRFTPERNTQTGSPYRNLLPPRAGGIALVLAAMGSSLRAILDVTVAYPGGVRAGGLWDLCCGRVRAIAVDVRQRPIEAWITDGDYENDAPFRERFQKWLGSIWAEKDELIDRMTGQAGSFQDTSQERRP